MFGLQYDLSNFNVKLYEYFVDMYIEVILKNCQEINVLFDEFKKLKFFDKEQELLVKFGEICECFFKEGINFVCDLLKEGNF